MVDDDDDDGKLKYFYYEIDLYTDYSMKRNNDQL
jgi:hypothetical protein